MAVTSGVVRTLPPWLTSSGAPTAMATDMTRRATATTARRDQRCVMTLVSRIRRPSRDNGARALRDQELMCLPYDAEHRHAKDDLSRLRDAAGDGLPAEPLRLRCRAQAISLRSRQGACAAQARGLHR